MHQEIEQNPAQSPHSLQQTMTSMAPPQGTLHQPNQTTTIATVPPLHPMTTGNKINILKFRKDNI